MLNLFSEDWTSAPETRDETLLKMQWIIRMRWIALLVQSCAAIPALYFEYLEKSYCLPYLAVIFILMGFNSVYAWLLPLRQQVTEMDLLLQLTMDVAGLTLLLLLTGGAANPFLSLLFLHTSLGALLLKKPKSTVFLFCVILCLAFLQFVPLRPPALRYGPTPRPVLFISYLIVALVTWRLTSWLSETLLSLRNHVHQLGERKIRNGSVACRRGVGFWVQS